jgi:lipid-A-disaccharide synthase-like uncharacterized protein
MHAHYVFVLHDLPVKFWFVALIFTFLCLIFFFKQSVPALPLDAESQNPGTNYIFNLFTSS